MKLIKGENSRVCSRCKELLHFDNFTYSENYKYNHVSECYDCRKRYNQLKKDYGGAVKTLKFKHTKDKLLKEGINAKFCSKCDTLKDHTKFNRNKSKTDGRACYCRECQNKYKRKYRKENPDKFKQYEINNKEKLRKIRRDYVNKRRRTDPTYRLQTNLRKRIWKALKGINKSKRTIELLGCSIEQFKQHLKEQFEKGMCWANYGRGGWHVDHIRPCASFDLSCPNNNKNVFTIQTFNLYGLKTTAKNQIHITMNKEQK